MEDTASKHQILTFTDENAGAENSVDTVFDDTYLSTVSSSENLEDFFRRPIKIATYEWSPGAEFGAVLDVWSEYFENKRVINRIANFNLLQATMCVKIIVNGNPFYFGRLMAFQNPLDIYDQFKPTGSEPTIFRNILRSQRPHIYIDPTESQGGCMTLPFFYPYNALSIPEAEWDRMGSIRFAELSGLKHANGATDPIQLTVYAWCKDIHLSVPTSDQPVMTAQSGTADEYGDGPISDTAFAVAEVAGKLKNAPTIGSYARATEMAARTVGTVAKAFGYSNPPDIGRVAPYQQVTFGRYSTTSGEDMAHKLTLDPKSEATIDPHVTGLDGTDEMDLNYLFKKESYLTSVTWGSLDVAGVRLSELKVTPQMYNRYSLTGGYFMTSLCHASIPFSYWRGNIKFRLQIVASKFHKGRLIVSWDPSYHKSAEENIQYSKIVDISEDRDITFEIGWGQPQPYAIMDIPDSDVNWRHRTSAYTSHDPNTNGVLSIRVLNPLAVTTDASLNNDIDINIFTSAGEGFEVFSPRRVPQMSPFEDQSYDGPMEEQSDVMDAPLPETTPSDTMGETVSDKSTLIYHGDPVSSLRQLLKRYDTGYMVPMEFYTTAPLMDGGQTHRYYLTSLLPCMGYNPQSIFASTTAEPYSFWYPNFINWYANAYMGYRGSIRHKFQATAVTPEGNPVTARLSAQRVIFEEGRIGWDDTAYTPNSSDSQSVQVRQSRLLPHGAPGFAQTSLSNNPSLTVEIPWYGKSRFAIARENKFYDQTNSVTGHPSIRLHTFVSRPGIEPDHTRVSVDSYTAAGEDFSLSYHVGPPVLYYTSFPLAAV
jgi:hypothetical protein